MEMSKPAENKFHRDDEILAVPCTSTSSDDMHDAIFVNRGCCFIGYTEWWERIRSAEKEDRWWTRGWNAVLKLREWSELAAGPRWKTFIRRFNRGHPRGYHRHTGSVGNYDPLSYALNFDERPNYDTDDDYLRRDFSSRYALIPNSNKGSMELGKDGPSFT